MTLSDSVSAAVAVLRRRPAEILPFYLLGAAVPAIARVVPFLGLVAAALYLEATGRLAEIRTVLVEDVGAPPDLEDPEALEAWVTELEPLADQLFTLPMGVLALVTVALTVLALLLLSAAAAASQLGACYGRLRDERGLFAGLAGARRYWLRFLGLYVLEFACWIAAAVVVGAGAAIVAGIAVAVTGSTLVAGLVALPALLLALVAFAAIRAVFAFAPVAVVVDDAGVRRSLSRTVGFVRHQPAAAAFYYVIAVGSVIALSTVTGVLALVDVPTLGTLVTTLLLFPFLDLLKTALYGGAQDRLSPPARTERSPRRQFVGGLRRGWRELLSFVRATPLTHAFVVVAAVASFWVGWTIAEPLVGTFETSIDARLEGHLPPAAALEFFGNNWMVAFTTAYAGLALAIPALASLLFNGVVLGIYARLEVDLTELAAFVVPHGVLEIPAILIAGALGLWLGVIGGRALRGRADRGAVADALERAFWVVVGLGILLAVAAFVEGFVSPYYYDPFL